MNNFRKHSKKIALLLILGIVFANCTQQDDQNLSPNNNDLSATLQQSETVYSGEELFKAIFFAQGEFAKNISMYEEAIKQSEEGNKMNEKLFLERYENFVKEVTEKNPNFFTNFQKDMYSGNPFDVDNALKAGEEQIAENLDVIMPEIRTVIQNLEKNPEVLKIVAKKGTLTPAEKELINESAQAIINEKVACGPWFCAYVWHFAIAFQNTVGLSANIYLYFNLWGPKLDNYKNSSDNGADLKNEILINDIVRTLKK